MSKSCFTCLDFIQIFKDFSNLISISIFEFEDIEEANNVHLDIIKSEIQNII